MATGGGRYPGSSGHRSAFGNPPPSGAGQRKTLPGHRWDDGAPGMPRSGGPMAPGARPLWLLALWTLAGPARSGAAEAGDGGWQRRGPGAPAAVPEEERCAVERRSDLSYSEFVQHYAFSRPVVLQGLTDNSRFRALCSRERLLASFGERVVRLSTANTYSYRKVDLPFREYVEHLLHPQDPTALGNANGRHFFSTTPHPRLVCWAPPLRTASALQELVLGCLSTGTGPGSQR
ncbi:jmjC domain-containing protein 8 isoform X5 [Hyaena hyaena]|uniref:jmjC domain-containing protein 8 isoform X5 n=1 Tax=Hyaena hyaena TaxID=95912 RepID=UPI00192152DD|nr:jmjC domain-containing protein 8 isoform X5 [Hyaena hyaena]